MRDPLERLRDIIAAIEAIERYQNISYEDLENNDLLPVWFVRHLEIIGEAVRALPQEVKAMDRSVQWSEIIGMRNMLVHQYFMIDLDIVWKVVQNDIPILKTQIQNLLTQLERGNQ
ncbi:HepT-like ribonuclease domain-containing protein [Thermostichus vulcanus]|uniref:DUF86 domain-containing protein n=1 Tax=Thermostichus vulcanus str. 'Rupite' TaxID=2813851 RepID=A0ABT0C8L9_THEVL|nr:DUF86 domain-containing protein [Thermostichus vulcanus]MCJ2542137.1 DUF86 domain-containing protein [Thermostichus vulcanus str. 'Rupite']